MNYKNDKYLITGATGNVGSELVKRLDKDKMLIATRNIKKAKKILEEGFEYTKFDFKRPETYRETLKRVKKIFLVRPPKISNVQKYIFPIIDRAEECGVEHIVFLSLLGVEKNPIVPHHKIEKYIQESNIPYAFLRASFFMQNLNTTHRKDIKENNEIFVPAGKGKTSFIDVRDIAEVGVKVLKESGHKNKAYPLTGKEALDYYQVAEAFREVLDREITYPNPSIFKFFWRMKKRGYKPIFIFVMIGLYTTARLGLAKRTTEDLQNLLDREPKSIKEYVQDYREQWL